MSLIDNSKILLRDSDEEIAQACLELLDDQELWLGLGSAARQKAMSLYDVANVRTKIAELVRPRLVVPHSDYDSLGEGVLEPSEG